MKLNNLILLGFALLNSTCIRLLRQPCYGGRSDVGRPVESLAMVFGIKSSVFKLEFRAFIPDGSYFQEPAKTLLG